MAPRQEKGKKKVGESSGDPAPAPGVKEQTTGWIKERLFKQDDFLGIHEHGIEPHLFMERFLEYGWESFATDLPNGNPVFVHQFYREFNKQIRTEDSLNYHHTTVAGKRIKFSPEIIERFLGINRSGAEHFSLLPNAIFPDTEVLQWALVPEAHIHVLPTTPRFQQSDLTDEAWYLQLWAAGSLYPTSTHTSIAIAHLRALYAILMGRKLDLGTHIFNLICNYGESVPQSRNMPFPCIITGICRTQKISIPSSGDTIRHTDRLTRQSLESRARQLRAKRPRTTPAERGSGAMSAKQAAEPTAQPAAASGSPFETTMLDMMQGLRIQMTQLEDQLGAAQRDFQSGLRDVQDELRSGREETARLSREVRHLRSYIEAPVDLDDFDDSDAD